MSRSGVGPGARAHAVAHVDDAGQQIVKAGGALQIAQTRRVGRGDIHGDVACDRRKRLDQAHIVRDAIGAVAVGADIHPDDAALVRAPHQPRQHTRLALVVEAEPVDHGLVGVETEEARTRIALLRARRDGANFDEAETEAEQRVRHFGVLVEAGRDADRIGEIQPEYAGREFRIVGARARQGREPQARQSQPMRVLRIEGMQEGPGQTVE